MGELRNQVEGAPNARDLAILQARAPGRKSTIPESWKPKIVELYLEREWSAKEIAAFFARKLREQDRYVEARILKIRIERYMRTHDFRMRILEGSTDLLALDAGKITKSLSEQAQRGRVDAIKLALEITGVYSPKATDPGPATVQLVINGVPRPNGALIESTAEEIDDGS